MWWLKWNSELDNGYKHSTIEIERIDDEFNLTVDNFNGIVVMNWINQTNKGTESESNTDQ